MGLLLEFPEMAFRLVYYLDYVMASRLVCYLEYYEYIYLMFPEGITAQDSYFIFQMFPISSASCARNESQKSLSCTWVASIVH